ncbi:MAG: ATP-binding cassette domain-containing protein [Marmoricola sp.]
MATGSSESSDRAPVLHVSGLGHRYDSREVYADLDFDLGPGTTGLVGVNGAGKTTLLQVLATVQRPTAGAVRLTSSTGERDDVLAVRRRIALAPQTFVPPRAMRVESFLTYVAWMRGLRASDRPAEVARVLDLVDLVDRRRDRVRVLSGGMVQRVNVAQALLGRPEVLLLDEPMSGLDPEQRVRLRQLVGRIGEHVAVLLSTHVMDDVVPVASRILMLDRGRIAFDGTPDDLAVAGARVVTPESGISVYEAAFLALRTSGSTC